MKKMLKMLFLLLIPYYSHAQEEGFDVVIEYDKVYEVDFKVYVPKEQVIKIVDNETQANRRTPEGLVQSYFSKFPQSHPLVRASRSYLL